MCCYDRWSQRNLVRTGLMVWCRRRFSDPCRTRTKTRTRTILYHFICWIPATWACCHPHTAAQAWAVPWLSWGGECVVLGEVSVRWSRKVWGSSYLLARHQQDAVFLSMLHLSENMIQDQEFRPAVMEQLHLIGHLQEKDRSRDVSGQSKAALGLRSGSWGDETSSIIFQTVGIVSPSLSVCASSE